MSSVLIDTSLWIEFLKGRERSEVASLEALIEMGDACICEVVFSEICFGARDAAQLKRYGERFSEFPFLALPAGWHSLLSEMGFRLRKAGHRPFLADLMIALTALHHRVPLMTLDKDFIPYRKLFGLELAS